MIQESITLSAYYVMILNPRYQDPNTLPLKNLPLEYL